MRQDFIAAAKGFTRDVAASGWGALQGSLLGGAAIVAVESLPGLRLGFELAAVEGGVTAATSLFCTTVLVSMLDKPTHEMTKGARMVAAGSCALLFAACILPFNYAISTRPSYIGNTESVNVHPDEANYSFTTPMVR